MLYYNQTAEHCLKSLKSSPRGLKSTDADKRLDQYGPNSIDIKGEPLWKKLIAPFADVFMLVLAAAGVISLLHGSLLDAIIIWFIVLLNAVTYYIQRFSAERVLRSLRQHSPQIVDVIRDGSSIQVDATRLVPGDVVSLTEGDRVPADGRLISAHNLRIDEAMLTGESEPVDKHTRPLSGQKEVYERSNSLFQGSFVVAGDAHLLVTATGNQTEFGQLAALSAQTDTRSPIQSKIDKLVRQIVVTVAGLSVVAFFLALRNGMDLADSLSFVMALAVSAVPEGLPIAISVILVLGIRRMAQKKAFMRSMRAIETLGVVTTIATDKTGTLTKNQLAIQEVWSPVEQGVELAQAASRAAVVSGETIHDPLDAAIVNYATAQSINRPQPDVSLPFNQALALSGNLYSQADGYRLSLKGSPEKILSRSDLTEEEVEQATLALHKLTSSGYRVIGLAEAMVTKNISDLQQLDQSVKLRFIGLLGIADSLRPEAKRAIAQAEAAGVSVRMITGDHFETAYSIGRQLGMVTSRDQVFDSSRIGLMSDEDLAEAVDKSKIFSRVTPEHKFRLLTVLKQRHITAMTGDGVNDVPALSNAHIGITMGSGTEIAKDAGDMILLDNNFKSIIDAMREGRVIVANIRRMLYYLLSTNAGEALTIVGALLIGIPAPLLPVQILWINLVTDTSMVIPLGLEPGEKDVMTRKPERPNAPILARSTIIRMISIALTMTIVTLSLYVGFSNLYGHEYGRTIAFSALVVMQWANAFNARSNIESVFSRIKVVNGKFYIGLVISIILQVLVIVGPLQDLLHIAPVDLGHLILTGAIAFGATVVVDEVYKLIIRRKPLDA